MTSSVSQSFDYSEGASSAPACSTQCYEPIQYHEHLVSLNFQPHGQQKTYLSLVHILKCKSFGSHRFLYESLLSTIIFHDHGVMIQH